MRKNRMMRAASALLVAVLMTTCTISGTFAKYVTEASAEDTARVAKWGVTVTTTANAFADEYATDDISVSGTIAKSVISINAADPDVDKVIAPGTSGTLATATIIGKPEVAVNVKKEATLTLTGWEVEGVYYCPLTIAGKNGMDYSSAAEFAAAVEAVVENGAGGTGKNYAPLTTLDSTDDVNVGWTWNFTGGVGQTDELDTKLGNLATAPTIAFTLTTTVTQID